MINDKLKKEKEYVWADIFVDHINKEHGFDYVVELYEAEDQPIDALAISARNQFPKLKMQLTYAIEVPFVYNGVKSQSPDYSTKPTEEAIEKKFHKFMHHHIYMHDIILIIEGYMNEEHAKEVFTDEIKKKYGAYLFQGIYYVSPTMKSDETGEVLQSSYIIPLKDAFKKK